MSWFIAVKKWILNAIGREQSSQKIALSCAWGIYIAVSPFVGMHTVLVLLCSWLFSLNGPVTLLVSKIVNNPLTVVPLYALSHTWGIFLLQSFGIDPLSWNPAWMHAVNEWLAGYIGLPALSLGALFVGTHSIGIAAALISYPLINYYVALYKEQGAIPF